MSKKHFVNLILLIFLAVLVDVTVVVAKLPNYSGHLLHLNELSAVTVSGHRSISDVGFIPQLSCWGVIDHVLIHSFFLFLWKLCLKILVNRRTT